MDEMSELDLYRLACHLRTMAERSNDPHTYRLAADKFAQAGFASASARCYERARYYEEMTLVVK